MGQCISQTFRATYINSKEKYSSNNSVQNSRNLRTTFKRTNILNLDKLVFRRICLMMFKHNIGDVH